MCCGIKVILIVQMETLTAQMKTLIVRMKTLTVPMMIILRQILKKQLKRNIAKKNYLE